MSWVSLDDSLGKTAEITEIENGRNSHAFDIFSKPLMAILYRF
jgi:hypothetical protein